MSRRVRRCLAVLGLMLIGAAASAEEPRTWKMGFSFLPPRPTVKDVLTGIDSWSRRAEIAAIHEELPWRDLLSGMSPEAILARDKTELVKYMRGKGLELYFMGELNDGLARGEEAPQLRALRRSITEPAVQRVYRDYLLAVARDLRPEYLGLMAETNLVREMADPGVYAAAVRTANETAHALRAAGYRGTLIVSVQVEAAWGQLGKRGDWRGIERDFADFPFMQVLGLSSYPWFAFRSPEDIPTNYYARLLAGRDFPAMVVEGGWPSARAGALRSTRTLQARYVTRHARLLDRIRARALIQLTYSDLDLASFPAPLPAILPLFAELGLVESDFDPKPALAAWDRLFARKLAR